MSQPPANNTIGAIPIAGDEDTTPPRPETPPPPPDETPRRGRGWRWWFFLPPMLIAAYLLAGFVAVPYFTRTLLASRLTADLNRPVTIGGVEFNPFTLSLTLHNGIIGPDLARPGDPVDPLLSFRRMRLDLAAVSLLKGGVFSRRTDIERLFLHVVRESDGTYNLAGFMPSLVAAPGREPALPFSLNNITLTNGRLLFDDRPTGHTHTVDNITLDLPSLGNVSHQVDQYIKPRFSATVNGSPLHLTGETELTDSGLTARLNLKLEQLDLAANLAYLPPILAAKVVKGEADLDFKLVFATGPSADTRLLLKGTGTCRDLWLQDDNGLELAHLPLLTFKGDFAPLAGSYRFTELALEKPEFTVERTTDSHWSLVRLHLPEAASWTVDRFNITGGKLTFLDRAVTGGFTDTWSGIQFTLAKLATGAKQPASFAAEGLDSAGSHVAVQGEVRLAPLAADGLLVVDQLELPRLAPYLSGGPDLFLKSGRATKLQARFHATAGTAAATPALSLSQGAMELHGLVIAAPDADRLSVPALEVHDFGVNSTTRQVSCGSLSGAAGRLHLDLRNAGTPPAADQPPPPPPSWHFDLKELALAQAKVVIDQTDAPAHTMTVNDLRFGLATAAKPAATSHLVASGRIAPAGGPFRLAGEVTARPFTARLDLDLVHLPLADLTPFVGPVTALRATGIVDAKGRLSLPEWSFSGHATLADFAGRDPAGAEILHWRNATADGLLCTASPFTLAADRVGLTHPAITWRLRTDGSSELPSLLSRPKPLAQAGPLWKIKQLSFTDGTVAFSDQSVVPPFATRITGLGGHCTDFGSADATFSLNGTVNGGATLTASGAATLPAATGDLTLHLTTDNFAVATLAPYLAPHLGYSLAGGHLAMTTDYRRRGESVTADSHLEINALDIGRPLNGSRQLALTVALLTDPRGQLKLDLPVTGKEGAADFSVRGGMIRALRNLLLKTAVTPAALLADLNHNTPPATQLAFAPGRADLAAAGRAQLQTLATILAQRPQLLLTLTGHADGRSDRAALATAARRDEEQRRAAEARRQAAQLSAELAKTYGREEIRTPTADGQPSSPDASRAITPTIGDNELLILAKERATAVQRFLLTAGVAPERLRLAAKPILDTVTESGPTGNRVDLGLTTSAAANGEASHEH